MICYRISISKTRFKDIRDNKGNIRTPSPIDRQDILDSTFNAILRVYASTVKNLSYLM